MYNTSHILYLQFQHFWNKERQVNYSDLTFLRLCYYIKYHKNPDVLSSNLDGFK